MFIPGDLLSHQNDPQGCYFIVITKVYRGNYEIVIMDPWLSKWTSHVDFLDISWEKVGQIPLDYIFLFDKNEI